MREHVNGPWREGGVDRIIFGSPGAEVRGIGTAMMCTFDVLKEAVKANVNLIITHEPTFWSHQDTLTEPAGRPTLPPQNGLHAAAQPGLVSPARSLARAAPGGRHQLRHAAAAWLDGLHGPGNQRMFTLPPTTLLALSQSSAEASWGRGRCVSSATLRLPVRRVYESWGNCGVFPACSSSTAMPTCWSSARRRIGT